MALAQVNGVVLSGLAGAIVRVEVVVGDGLPSVGVIGLPDASVNEARWRARCAIEAIGASWPNRRITVSLSPAELRKQGSGLDLPIAVGVLAASGAVPRDALDSTTFIGELGLDGSVRPARGALAGALAAREKGLARVVVPSGTALELGRLSGIGVEVADHLIDVVAVISGEPSSSPAPEPPRVEPATQPDLSDVRGHPMARLALEVAAAGGHHVALIGSPGIGKSLLALRLGGLLPDLDDDMALEVAAIHGLVGPRPLGMECRPPVCAPHHGASAAAVLGSVQGARAIPGSISLAHRGVLVLDEAPEFSRTVLEGMRQPLEDGSLSLARAGWSGRLPATFQLVLTANPCPCGYRMGTGSGCTCAPQAVRRYAARLSGPIMDRVDIRLGLQRPTDAELSSLEPGECSADVRSRVAEAQLRARARLAPWGWRRNADVSGRALRRELAPDAEGERLLAGIERRSASLRGPDRILRMAWTLADLAGRAVPAADDVATAAGLRGAGMSWS
jgi:magnesium chelatase family protein